MGLPKDIIVLGIIGGGAYLLYKNWGTLSSAYGSEFDNAFSSVEDAFAPGVEDVESSLIGWAGVDEGPTWVPVINQTESALGIPVNLLARMAYEESHFRPDIITGATASSAGAQGILQLEPTSFPSLRLTPPYSTQDTQDQISAAGQYLMQLYEEFNDWSQAVGAYNAGPGTMNNALSTGAALPSETTTYVAQIFADVPVAAINLPA